MKKIVLPVALALLGMNAGAYAADVSIDILSATVKDKRIEGASVTLQRNGAQSVSGITNTSGSISLGTSFADNKDALLIVKKRVFQSGGQMSVRWHDLCYQSGDDESGWHACSFELGRKAF
ncbi:hypothetical protein MUTS15_21850 [Escherichia coli]|nr:hypothetical protein MUTS15_21850 [Escherichia coli]